MKTKEGKKQSQLLTEPMCLPPLKVLHCLLTSSAVL